jgi:hypothetical protein
MLPESLIFHDGLALEVAYENTSSQLERIIDDVSRNDSRLTYDVHFMKDASSLQPILAELIRRKSNEAVPAVGAYHRCIDPAWPVAREVDSGCFLSSSFTLRELLAITIQYE